MLNGSVGGLERRFCRKEGVGARSLSRSAGSAVAMFGTSRGGAAAGWGGADAATDRGWRGSGDSTTSDWPLDGCAGTPAVARTRGARSLCWGRRRVRCRRGSGWLVPAAELEVARGCSRPAAHVARRACAVLAGTLVLCSRVPGSCWNIGWPCPRMLGSAGPRLTLPVHALALLDHGRLCAGTRSSCWNSAASAHARAGSAGTWADSAAALEHGCACAGTTCLCGNLGAVARVSRRLHGTTTACAALSRQALRHRWSGTVGLAGLGLARGSLTRGTPRLLSPVGAGAPLISREQGISS